MTAAPPLLAPDLAAGLRRLKLAACASSPRTADHREDPAVGPRGTAAHPGRGRDHRPGSLQRPHPHEAGRVPGDQDPRGVRPHRVPGAQLLSLPPAVGQVTAAAPGERNPKVLAQLARTAARRKIAELEEALEGAEFFTSEHAALLATMLARIDRLTARHRPVHHGDRTAAGPLRGTAQIPRL